MISPSQPGCNRHGILFSDLDETLRDQVEYTGSVNAIEMLDELAAQDVLVVPASAKTGPVAHGPSGVGRMARAYAAKAREQSSNATR